MCREEQLPDAFFGAVERAADVAKIKIAAISVGFDLIVADTEPCLDTPCLRAVLQVDNRPRLCRGGKPPFAPADLPERPTKFNVQ